MDGRTREASKTFGREKGQKENQLAELISPLAQKKKEDCSMGKKGVTRKFRK